MEVFAYSDNVVFSVEPQLNTIQNNDSIAYQVIFSPTQSSIFEGEIIFRYGNSFYSDTIQVQGIGTGIDTAAYIILDSLKNWQLISLPVKVNCPYTPGGLFAYSNGYIANDTINNGIGYWKKFQQPMLSFIGFANTSDTIAVNSGWNLIGSITEPISISAITTEPSGIISSLIYGYKSRYIIADIISPGMGYWVKVKIDGILILSSQVTNRNTKLSAAAADFKNFNSIIIDDAVNQRQTLYFDKKPNESFSIDFFDLPPVPPLGVFDVRFASQRMLEIVEGDKSKEFPIKISSAEYPVTISWEMKSNNVSASLKIGDREEALSGKGEVKIIDSELRISLKITGTPEIPKEYALEQNHPNPFNPSTAISYHLPVASLVTLKVYNLLGQEVRTLANEIQGAGFKSVDWNSTNNLGNTVSSGVYFYRIEATSVNDPGKRFTQVKKMLLIR
jgi:hypothetical protein